MPASYAHMVAASEAVNAMGALPNIGLRLGDGIRFVSLGAVSPDYPYLAISDRASAAWAERMHLGRNGVMVTAGVRYLRDLVERNAEERAVRNCTAWLAGFLSHMTLDMTVHPVVNLRVGPYEDNKTAHRICEMHQDLVAHRRIYDDLLTRDAEHFDRIRACGGDESLDPRMPPPCGAPCSKRLIRRNAPKRLRTWIYGAGDSPAFWTRPRKAAAGRPLPATRRPRCAECAGWPRDTVRRYGGGYSS